MTQGRRERYVRLKSTLPSMEGGRGEGDVGEVGRRMGSHVKSTIAWYGNQSYTDIYIYIYSQTT